MYDFYHAILMSLGLGLIVGLQREWKSVEIAGIRTFPLICLMGTLTSQVGTQAGVWLIAGGLLALAGLLLIANLSKIKAEQYDPGMTTEVAALVMYLVGAAVGKGLVGVGIVITGIVAVLLHWKQPLHGLVSRIGEKDFRGVIHLILIALVILPILPDETFGPYDVLNPYRIWLMVVLIVGISMAAYVIYKLLGARVGAVLGGVLGGMISSTATTVSYARQSKDNADAIKMSALVIVIASTIVNVRVLLEIGVVAPQLLRSAAVPLLIMLVGMSLECGVIFLLMRRQVGELSQHQNPAQLKPAIIFGALYAAVLFVVAAAREHLGTGALYGIALISGLTDVDAITLSTAKLFRDGDVAASTAWRVIVVATLSNLVFKAGVVGLLGRRRLFAYVAVLFALAIALGLALLFLWPEIDLPVPNFQAYFGETPSTND